MEALTIRNNEIHFESIRCIGCGLCMSVCSTGALKIVEKSQAMQPAIPKNTASTYIRIAWLRSPGKVLLLGKMFVSNLWERLTGKADKRIKDLP
jgi:Fe-S-cluster-containing hydrogenase component 2